MLGRDLPTTGYPLHIASFSCFRGVEPGTVNEAVKSRDANMSLLQYIANIIFKDKFFHYSFRGAPLQINVLKGTQA
jgi:hypothetical protein